MVRGREFSFYLLSSRSTCNLEGRLEMKNSLADYYPIIIGVVFSFRDVGAEVGSGRLLGLKA